MFPNLEIEQTYCGYTEEYVAGRLGITRQEYHSRKETGSFLESEIRALVAIFKRSAEYLFEFDENLA
jgi:hypothetical protein